MADDTGMVTLIEDPGADGPAQDGGPEARQEPVDALESQLASAQEVLGEREREVARLADALAQAEEQVQQRSRRVAELEEALARTLARYRGALLAGSPEVPPDLVQGESAEALERSLAQGQQMVARIRQQVEASVAAHRVPPGAPIRSGLDLSGLSAREKIARALSGREG